VTQQFLKIVQVNFSGAGKHRSNMMAKTIPKWPHEYIVRIQFDDVLFEQLVRHIRANGYLGKFYQETYTFFDEGGKTFWTMGAPLEETTIIN
jgi:hypothetical protein